MGILGGAGILPITEKIIQKLTKGFVQGTKQVFETEIFGKCTHEV